MDDFLNRICADESFLAAAAPPQQQPEQPPAPVTEAKIIYNTASLMPIKATEGSCAYDLKNGCGREVTLKPMEAKGIVTGVFTQMPRGCSAWVLGRSGLAKNHSVFAHVGTIDSDFVDKQIQVILVNFGRKAYKIQNKERIGQLKFCENVNKVTVVKETRRVKRGRRSTTTKHHDGFGSTGRF